MDPLPVEKGDPQSIVIVLNDKNEVTKVDRQSIIQRRKPTCFEWIQLLAIISIPIMIALYLIVQKNNGSSTSVDGRRQKMHISDTSRITEQEMALVNEPNQIENCEKSEQTQCNLAADQHNQKMLTEYQMFLAKLIIDYGTNFSTKPEVNIAAQFLTVSTLKQLNAKHQAILLRSLYDSKMITLRPSDNLFAVSTIDLRQVNLSNVVFGLPSDVRGEITHSQRILWYYLWLPYSILTNASFRGTSLDCASFESATMDSVDLSYTYHTNPQCVKPIHEGQTSFISASLIRASFYKANVRFTSFDLADLSFANMCELYCMHCTFSSAKLYHANLTSSFVFNVYISHSERLDFRKVNFSHAVAHSAHYRSINFDQSDWSNIQASKIIIDNSTFTNATLNNCSFVESLIFMSIFENANLRMVDFSEATLRNVTFINSNMSDANLSSMKCEYCHFNNVTFRGAVLRNASFENSNFVHCDIDMNQLEQVVDLSGSTLSNETVHQK